MLQGQSNYCSLYPEDCSKAQTFYSEHQSLFETAAQKTGLPARFLFAIVAPEFTQYSYLSNKIETYSLKVFYVQRGKAYSDFSIGCFQMKPSCIEQMEAYASADSLLKAKYSFCLFARPDERASRVERINRLNTVAWQIDYLALFCEIMQRQFAHLAFQTQEEKLRFYASAYNCGFHKSEQQIKETALKALFPHFSKQKFKYADISVWFYRLKK
jgi:hypothetical protein